MKRRELGLIVVFLVLIVIAGVVPATACVPQTSEGFPPEGFVLVARRVMLTPADPFVELDNATLDAVPALRVILEGAVYWAQRNMNETQYWVSGEELYQTGVTLNDAYRVKYGMTSYEYAEVYSTSIAVPVVAFSAFCFAISESAGDAITIRREVHREGDPYLEWNGSVLEAIPELRSALDTAVAWAKWGVNETVYFFELAVHLSILYGCDQASHDKYGMDWFNVAVAHNMTHPMYPIVAYGQYHFSLDMAAHEQTTEPSPWMALLLVAGVAIAGFGLLGVSLVSVRRLRLELSSSTEASGERTP